MPNRPPPLEAAKQPVDAITLRDVAPGKVCIAALNAATAEVRVCATGPRRSSISAYRELGDASPATPVANGNYAVGESIASAVSRQLRPTRSVP